LQAYCCSLVRGILEEVLNLPAGIVDNNISIGCLKLLVIGAKLVRSGNRDLVKYSIHDAWTPGLLLFYEFPDNLLFKKNRSVRHEYFM
jgi:hypothetical protein